MNSIYISSDDYRRISKVIADLTPSGSKVPPTIQKLKEELSRAIVINAVAISPHVVALHSSVQLRDLKTGELEEWILTMPEHADPDEKRISVLAPVGTAILGFSEGDEIEWETPGGVRQLKVKKVQHNAFSEPELPRSLYG